MPLQLCFSFPSLPFPSLSHPKASQYSPVEEQSAANEEPGGLHLPPLPDLTPRHRPADQGEARHGARADEAPVGAPAIPAAPRQAVTPVTQRALPKRPATAALYPLWARPSSSLFVARLSPPTAPGYSEARWPRSRPPRHRPLSCVPGAGGRRAGHTASHPLPPSPRLCVQEPGWPGLGPALQGPHTCREGATQGDRRPLSQAPQGPRRQLTEDG